MPRNPDPQVLYDVTVADGKYRFVYYIGARLPEAYRHGERWPSREHNMIGDKALMCLVGRIDELENP